MEKQNFKTVLITGCDVPGSYGYELALLLDKQGYSLFAGCTDCNSIGARSLASRGSEKLAVMQIDVRSEENIDDAVEMIKDSVGDEGVWAVVNCSETYVIAEVDWCSTEDFKNVIEVNFMGTVRVTKAMLPLLQKSRGGRIINLSSSSGLLSRAGQSAYCASKYAIEAFSDSLRQEMSKWGVFVSIVEPVFCPDPKEALTSPATQEVLSRISEPTRRKYGAEYFRGYIEASLKDLGTDADAVPTMKQPENPDKGYHTWKKPIGEPAMKRRSHTLPPNSSPNSKNVYDRKSKSPGGTAAATLTKSGGSKLSQTNRVLNALMDATTSQSPKIRYFVGTFNDRCSVMLCGSVLPTCLTDTYMTYGEISAVVPNRIKEKLD